MNPQAIAFKGEVQFRRYSDTSTQGQQVVFAVSDRDALAPFIGKEGKRYMAVLVEIGDDEQPVIQPKMGDLCRMAVMFCKDPMFIDFIDQRFSPCLTEFEAKQALYEVLGIASRRDLDSDPKKADAFHTLIRKPFLAWKEKQ